tara:strand:+ start:193 stop:1068 length:876 start_codon:yes stop_codon:yes gene_type:complete
MRKGILLAGGKGTRLHPLTKIINKHFLSIYDKPMFYYPLSTLMLMDIKEILIISNEEDLPLFRKILGSGNKLGLNLEYSIQENPNGVAEAFIIGESFIKNNLSALILGDNIFHGNQLTKQFKNISKQEYGASVLACPVNNPESYGIVEFDNMGKVLDIVEKPANPKSKYALTGLYLFDKTVVEKAKQISKSSREEYEITDINKLYLKEGSLHVNLMSRGMAWLDTGTCESMHDASNYIKTLQQRQGILIGCPEEIAWRKGWINDQELESLFKPLIKTNYGLYLESLLKNNL